MANAPLQIEVHEVRINPSSADGMSSSMGGGGGMSGTRLRALELARPAAAGRVAASWRAAGAVSEEWGGEVSAFDREPQIADVIVRGTVYIFNPPDPTALAVGAEDSMDF